MKIHLRREGDTLKPMSENDFDDLKRIKEGDIIYVDYKKPRNPQFHNKFMSLVRVVFDNNDHYETIESLLNVFKVELGYFDTVWWRDIEIRIPRSISFAKMDEMEFRQFYDSAVTMALHRFLPTVTTTELEEYVNKIARYG